MGGSGVSYFMRRGTWWQSWCARSYARRGALELKGRLHSEARGRSMDSKCPRRTCRCAESRSNSISVQYGIPHDMLAAVFWTEAKRRIEVHIEYFYGQLDG